MISISRQNPNFLEKIIKTLLGIFLNQVNHALLMIST